MKKFKRLFSLLLAAVMLISVFGSAASVSAAGSNTIDINVVGTYGQTDARNMLSLINRFRTGPDAWYLNPDGSKNMTKIGKLQELQYDYGLEEIAMKRAAEIAVMFDHERPNGQSIIGTFFDYSVTMAENIAFRQTTPYSALEYWKETDQPYELQGHRRSLLGVDGDYKYVGIGHFVMNGLDYWVQEFSADPMDTQQTQPVDADAKVKVEILKENITALSASMPSYDLKLEVEDTGELVEALPCSLTFYNHAPADGTINAELVYDWVLPQNDIVSRKGNKVTALKTGTVTATATIFTGDTTELEIIVSGCDHVYQSEIVREPSCKEKGIKQYTCSVCGRVKTEYLDLLPHSYVESRVEPTCTEEGQELKICSVCGDTISYPIDKLPHEYNEYEIEKEPTCTEKGLKVGYCIHCQKRVAEEIPMVAHQLEETEYPATCQAEGRLVRKCKVCPYEETETLPKLSHNWQKISEKAPTYYEVGEEIYECSKCHEKRRVELARLVKNGWFEEAKGTRFYKNDAYLKYWQEIDGKRYFFDNEGYRLENGRYIIDDKATYLFDVNGVMQTGWKKISNRWYYFNNNGAMLTGWQKIGGKWYLFKYADGSMLTGWVKSGSKWYFFNSSGVMLTGWQKLSGKWYFFNGSGAMLTGWQKLSGKWYFFNSSGAMVSGWQKISGKWYYFNGGVMVTGSRKIGSKTYRFNSSGVCLNP